MSVDGLHILIYVLTALVIALIALVVRLEIRLKNLLRGEAGSIEETLKHLHRVLDGHQSWREKTDQALGTMEKRLRRSVQAVRTIRFNPFADQGGNQSFATAFLNEEGDGVIISSLYSRDKVGIYAKPVKANDSEHELSDEEAKALEEAKL